MATACAGVTATWNSLAFGEVASIRVIGGGQLPLGRSTNWTNEAGTVEIACFATANISSANYGRMATLDISGGGMTFTHKAILQRFELTGTVNDVARYAATLRLVSIAGTPV